MDIDADNAFYQQMRDLTASLWEHQIVYSWKLPIYHNGKKIMGF
jgi:hypothetical protein